MYTSNPAKHHTAPHPTPPHRTATQRNATQHNTTQHTICICMCVHSLYISMMTLYMFSMLCNDRFSFYCLKVSDIWSLIHSGNLALFCFLFRFYFQTWICSPCSVVSIWWISKPCPFSLTNPINLLHGDLLLFCLSLTTLVNSGNATNLL